MTNPFERGQPAAQPQADNPFATPAPAQPQAGNPFGAGVPAAPAPAQPAWLAQPAPQAAAPAAYVPPAAPASGALPVLSAGALHGAPAPVPTGNAKGAKLAHMYGRLILAFPLHLTRQARKAEYTSDEQRAKGDLEQDLLVTTVVVLDDGHGGMSPITFGGDPLAFPVVPDTESSPIPYVRKAMWITQSKLIGQLEGFRPQANRGEQGMVLGRLLKEGQARNDPWFLQSPTPQETALAEKYLELLQAGTFPHPLAP